MAVPDSDQVVSALNRYIDDAVANGMTIYASRDWHPAVTSHCNAFGGNWPAHCVQGTDGARFHIIQMRESGADVVASRGSLIDEP